MEGSWNGAAGSNKYQYNGKEWNDDFGLGLNDYGARFYDPAIARWTAVDPMSEKYMPFSSYSYALNSPITLYDPDGNSISSTHTNENGKIVAVFDDGDNGVYKHTNWDMDKYTYSQSNTSASGKKMGETMYWDEFANHDKYGNVVGVNGNYANLNAEICFEESPFDQEMAELINMVRNNMSWYSDRREAQNWLAENSRRHHFLDIKSRIGESKGYKFKGYFFSGESLGNYLFGANLKNLKILYANFLPDSFVFGKAAEVFGAYHNSSNKVSNPAVAPYYGEIPYSGRNIVLGFWNNNLNNPIFKEHGKKAYESKK